MPAAPADFVTCPHCGDTDVRTGSRFCEGCGKPIFAPAAARTSACACGSVMFADGYCVDCGTRRRERRAQEDAVALGDGLAAATDTGRRHRRNDDGFALAGPPGGGSGTVLVVCDGVSNSQAPDLASTVAAKVARDALWEAISAGAPPRHAAREAVLQAHAAVCTVPFDRQADLDPPASTIVLTSLRALPGGDRIEATVAWLGDSRVYWLSRSGGGRLLTRDHSWRNSVVEEGCMDDDAARRDPMAHAITKCLGTVDFAAATPCPEPSVESFELPAEGWLLACTDGLWNYAETAGALIIAANGRLWTAPANEVCQQLVSYANRMGGSDNITCALARLD